MEIKDIRRNNLLTLLSSHASIRAFADRTGVPAAYVSQIKNEADGRGMGSKTARKIEEALGLPVGYMDQAHGEGLTSVGETPAANGHSPAVVPQRASITGTLEKWQVEDAARLKELFEANAKHSQEEFGRRFEIGSQGMVWQYLNARRALNTKAASNFARGLGIAVDAFSPRLAQEIRLASEHVADRIPTIQDSVAAGERPCDRIAIVMAEQHLDVSALAQLLAVEPPVVRAWLEPDAPKLGLHHAVKLQEAYGYSPAWLINGKGEPRLSNVQEAELDEPSLPFDIVPIPTSSYRRIPVVGMAQLGDNGHFSDIEYPVGHGDGFIEFPTRDPDAYGLRCNGDSMRPRVKHNEFVVVEPNHAVTNGDEVLVKSQDGRVMVKELAYVRDGVVHLSSVNERHGMVRIPQDQIERLQYVAGIVKSSAWRPD
ncbi:LexA family transcriptional regulator [Cupriavidus alkaliphilus]|uniref:Phage repressor protein C with HTH and peptisase S24 domain/transcriptional regulator with XRE-family HTH domain n=1 Tax=Cupriavidus alkaliphilus TaxID=942866 RepID=A0A7W4V6Q0_9BURK|nr:helix-turn-helix transcriptional regulator [Cupriavidus alkaliphilus]MBB3006018.1 phage repressor protein C with HTH and peptisase S24 domain/transcriptional regulator with XRE-family HTH domain [Cupriavidus alkaliphilus]